MGPRVHLSERCGFVLAGSFAAAAHIIGVFVFAFPSARARRLYTLCRCVSCVHWAYTVAYTLCNGSARDAGIGWFFRETAVFGKRRLGNSGNTGRFVGGLCHELAIRSVSGDFSRGFSFRSSHPLQSLRLALRLFL